MIRELMHDPLFLGQKAKPATEADMDIAKDLLETLKSHEEECVGMAANMIGELKRIIAYHVEGQYYVMFNPEIIEQMLPYDTEESCLSLLGGPRPCKRYNVIKVRYQNSAFDVCEGVFTGFEAQIIQHEVDHCNGVLIQS